MKRNEDLVGMTQRPYPSIEHYIAESLRREDEEEAERILAWMCGDYETLTGHNGHMDK